MGGPHHARRAIAAGEQGHECCTVIQTRARGSDERRGARRSRPLNFDQTSEELRIASPKGPFVDYVAGFYYLNAVDRERYERDVDTIGGAANGLNDGVGHYGSADDNYAVFGEANLNFTKSLRAILGVRDVWDDLSFYNDRVSTSATAVTGVQPTFAAAGSERKNGQADRVGVQYDVTSVRHLLPWLQGTRLQRLLQRDRRRGPSPQAGDFKRLRGRSERAVL